MCVYIYMYPYLYIYACVYIYVKMSKNIFLWFKFTELPIFVKLFVVQLFIWKENSLMAVLS